MEHCPNWGGQIKIVAAILEAPSIEWILTHLRLQARAPLRAPARADLQQAALLAARHPGLRAWAAPGVGRAW